MQEITKDALINGLQLERHPLEGGYYRRTYESQLMLEREGGSRKLMTSIYYMLTNDSPVGCLHRNQSDILHFYHSGLSIRYLIVSPAGEVTERVLGPNITKGETPQLLVKGGDWKAAELSSATSSATFGLLSEAVCPGFEYADNEIGTKEVIAELYPNLYRRLERFIIKA